MGDPSTAGVVDTHVHVVGADVARYPLRPPGVGSQWWSAPGLGTVSLLATLDRCGTGRAVVVQAVGAYGFDNSYALDSVAGRPDRLRAVAAPDMDGPAPDEEIHRLAARPGVAGVRLFGVSPGSAWTDDAGRTGAALAAAEEAGVSVVLTVFPGQLDRLGPLVAGRPRLSVALDHCGFPDLAGGRIAPDAPLLRWAGLSQVSLKVSSHVLLGAGGHETALVEQLAGAFGTARLMWGSDYPQTGRDYGRLRTLGAAACRDLAPAERDAFLGGNAASLYFPG